MSAYLKDIFRTIIKERKRLIALTIITILGVTMMTGLRAGCDDLRNSAEAFFDEHKLHDISIISTLGLTSDDIDALNKLDEIETVQGMYSEVVSVDTIDGSRSVRVKTFLADGIDSPYAFEGRLPEKADEIAVTRGFLDDSGLKIGEKLIITEKIDSDESANFINTSFTITGIVTDVTSIDNTTGTLAFRNTSTEDYTFFVIPAAIDSEVFTEVVLMVKDAASISSFSAAYTQKINQAMDSIENLIKSDRETARYNEIYYEAESKINEAESEAYEAFDNAEKELDDAKKKLNDGKSELEDGQKELDSQRESAQAQIIDARDEIAYQWQRIYDGYAQIDNGRRQLNDGQLELNAKKTAAFEQLDLAEAELEEKYSLAQAQLPEITSQVEALKDGLGTSFPENEWNDLKNSAATSYAAALAQGKTELDISELGNDITALSAAFGPMWSEQYLQLCLGQGQLEGTLGFITQSKAVLAENRKTAESQFAAAQSTIDEQSALLTNSENTLNEGAQMLASSEAELDSQEASMYEKLEEAQKKIDDGWKELEDGFKEYQDGLAEFEKEKSDAVKELADAREELDEIDMAVWYVQDRFALQGYSNITSDSDCIESIGSVFAIMFLVIAILISLTTITRMVEENRGLIGTYRALGFSVPEIRRKYTIYSSFAAILGGILGNVFGFVVLPMILFIIFKTMYLIPIFSLTYQPLIGIPAILIFVVAVLLATWITCGSKLAKMPAVLMRPRPPQSGSRVLLERWTGLWKKLSFLNKITARNIFRYKKRLLMTVLGIAGCTGLLLCGFAIKDTVSDLMPRQYENIIRYDLMVVNNGNDANLDMAQLLDSSDETHKWLNLQITSIKLEGSNGSTLSTQLYVIPNEESIEDFIALYPTNAKKKFQDIIHVDGDGIYVTKNAGIVLDFKNGDTIKLQDAKLNEVTAPVVDIIENYLGNSVFITQSYYEKLFGEYQPNAAFILLKDASDETALVKKLGEQSGISSITSISEIKDNFSASFMLMNIVVYVIIIMAGALAFVVLFTLSNTNISERERELATIKVLGFFDLEVHRYVNKETLLLTGIGIALGLPFGTFLSNMLTVALKIPAIYFAISIHTISFVIAAALTFIFALIVNLVTNRILNQIDPAVALKSIE